jgi:hypothetical protein
MKAYQIGILVLLTVSLLFISTGGFLDITNMETLHVSKVHLWMDGIWLLLLAVLLAVLFR